MASDDPIARLGPLPDHLRARFSAVGAIPQAEAPAAPRDDAVRPQIPSFAPFTGLPGWPALVMLAALVQWVAWRYVVKIGSAKATKVPIDPATGRAASTSDPATWGTYKASAARAQRDGLPGVGFVLTADDDLTGIDLDNCRDPVSGELEPWAVELIALGETYCEVSPSGRGVRLFASGKVEKATKHDPAGVEVYGRGRYLTVTGHCVEGAPDTIAPAPKTLAAVFARVEAFKAAARAAKPATSGIVMAQGPAPAGAEKGFFAAVNAAAMADLASWVPTLLPAARRSGTGYRVSSADLGRDLEEDLSITPQGIVDFGLADQGDDREGKRSPITLVREHGAAADAKAAAWWLCERLGVTPESLGWEDGIAATDADRAKLEDFVAYLPEHRFLHIPSGKLWPIQSIDKTLPSVPVPAKPGEEPKPLKPSTWLIQNRPVAQLAWHPGAPRMIHDRVSREGELVAAPGATIFNLYRPPEPSAAGDPTAIGPWIDHIRRLFPDAGDAQHIVAFMAHRVQHPGEKVNHALVLAGKPGIGKDTILAPLVKAVGPGNAQEIRPADLMAPFNGYMKSVVLRISEIHDLGEVNRYQFNERSKTVIATPPDYVRINEKHQPEYYCTNVCGVIMTTNRLESLCFSSDDRRHFVVQSPLEPKDLEPEFFTSIYGWYKGGGFDHVAAYLRTFDLSSFDAKATPRKTTAFWLVVDAGRAPENAELASAIERLGDPDALTLEQLREVTASGDLFEFGEWLRDRKNRGKVGHRLKDCGYTPMPNADASDRLWAIQSRRAVVYARHEMGQAERHRAAMALTQTSAGPRQAILRAVK